MDSLSIKHRMTPQNVILLGLFLLTFFGMTLEQTGPGKWSFWLLCVLPLLWLLVTGRGQVLGALGASGWLAISFLLFYLASIYWSAPTTNAAKGEVLNHAVETLLFVLSVAAALSCDRRERVLFAKLLIVCCFVGLVVAIVSFYSINPISRRLNSTAYLLNHSTQAAYVEFCCLVTAGLLLYRDGPGGERSWLAFGFATVGAFIFLTQTRAALVAFIILSVLWGSYYLGMRKAALIVVCAAAIGVSLVLWSHGLDSAWTNHVSTGLNGRLVIWKNALHAFIEKPLIGHGAAAMFSMTPYGKQVLAVMPNESRVIGLPFVILFFGGLLGFSLFLAYLAAIARKLWVRKSGGGIFGLSAVFCVTLMTISDGHSFVSEVNQAWWMWWLPTITAVFYLEE